MAGEPDFRICGHSIGNARQFIGCPPVVGIEEWNQFAAAFRNTVIKSGSLAAIGFLKNADLRGKFGQNFGGAVRGAVAHDPYFPLGGGEIPETGTEEDGWRLL
jgi:hypothetical protein